MLRVLYKFRAQLLQDTLLSFDFNLKFLTSYTFFTF